MLKSYTLVILVTAIFLTGLMSCGTKMTPEQMRAQAIDYTKKEDFTEAIKVYQKLVATYPDHEFAPEALYTVGTIYQKNLEKLNDAATAFEKLASTYPKHQYSEKALHQLGSLYLKDLKNNEAAIATYEKLIENFPESEWLESYQIMIGYIYADKMKDLEKAKTIFEKYSLTPGLIKKKAEELEKADLFDYTIAAYEALTMYPDSVHVDTLLYKLGTLYANNFQQFEKSIDSYKKLIDNYPESKLTIQSQFMIGYYYANDLKDLEKARKEYELFLSKYPKHELAASVKFELDHLGKDISDIEFLSNESKKTGDKK